GNREHSGADVICNDGSTIYAPFTGRLIGRANPYGNGNEIDNGVLLQGSGYCVKIFYVAPDRYSGPISKGQALGTLLNLQDVYPGIISHVHIQMCDKSDPTPYLL
ncbi:leukocyte cell-derived chemotaxin-2-like, partial [Rhincodon typus]|uniref:leukocyte cell-derived chemotaxin-2-like n=1 Tax=Rhincodon typus TaxID=259920 RepID=UPI0020301F5D